jgi:hypothetical protein
VEPDAAMAAAYRRAYPVFRALYPALRQSFQQSDHSR